MKLTQTAWNYWFEQRRAKIVYREVVKERESQVLGFSRETCKRSTRRITCTIKHLTSSVSVYSTLTNLRTRVFKAVKVEPSPWLQGLKNFMMSSSNVGEAFRHPTRPRSSKSFKTAWRRKNTEEKLSENVILVDQKGHELYELWVCTCDDNGCLSPNWFSRDGSLLTQALW